MAGHPAYRYRHGWIPLNPTAFAAQIQVDAKAAAAAKVAAAKAAEPHLTSAMQKLADRHGGQLAGLDFRLKSEDSLARKIASRVAETKPPPPTTAKQVAESLFDVNRYTTVFGETEYATKAGAALDELRAAGNTLKVKNYWTVPDNPYKGINVQVKAPDGHQFELQFHTPGSLSVKEGELHRLYEERRVETDPEKAAKLDAAMFAATAAITDPPKVQVVEVDNRYTPREQEAGSVEVRETAVISERAAATAKSTGKMLVQFISPGWGSSGYYSPEVLAEAAGNRVIPAGTHMYADHPSKSDEENRPERSIRDLMAVTTSDAQLADNGALIGEVRVVAPYAPLIEDLKDHIGVSIRGDATTVSEGVREGRRGRIIEGIAEVASVDFVTRPGRGGQVLALLESAGASVDEAKGGKVHHWKHGWIPLDPILAPHERMARNQHDDAHAAAKAKSNQQFMDRLNGKSSTSGATPSARPGRELTPAERTQRNADDDARAAAKAASNQSFSQKLNAKADALEREASRMTTPEIEAVLKTATDPVLISAFQAALHRRRSSPSSLKDSDGAYIHPALEEVLLDTIRLDDDMDPELREVVTSAQGAEGTAKLHAYWRHGEGAAKIRWGVGGDFARCVEHLSKYVRDPKGYCAKMHKDVTGATPGHAAGESDVPATRPDSTTTIEETTEVTMGKIQIDEAEHTRLVEEAGRVDALATERDTEKARADELAAKLAEVEAAKSAQTSSTPAAASRNPRQLIETQLAEQRSEIQALKAREQAVDIVREELGEAWVAPSTVARLTSDLLRDLPLVEGKLDVNGLRNACTEARTRAELEAAETLDAAGFGTPKGMGGMVNHSGSTPEKYTEEITEGFKAFGLSEAEATAAVKGR